MKRKIRARNILCAMPDMSAIAAEKALKLYADPIVKLYAQSFRIYFASLLASHMSIRLLKEKE